MKLQRIALASVAVMATLIWHGLSPAFAGTSELIGQLTSQLGVTAKQATGGAGSVFSLAKSKLSAEDFGKVASVVPDMDTLLSATPQRDATSSMTSPATSAASSLLGKGAAGSLGDLASLVGPFSQLGLSSNMIGKFVPVILDFVGGKGGPAVQSLLAGALK